MSDEAPRLVNAHGWAGRWAWVPIPLLLGAIAVLRAVAPMAVYESPLLVILPNFVFSTLVSAIVVILIARTFLASGRAATLLLGCGVVLWGAAGTVSPLVIHHGGNAMVTVHNILIWLSAGCHVAALLLSAGPTRSVRLPGLMLAIACAAVATVTALVAWLALYGHTPVFFIQGQGGTPLRQLVLGSAIGMYAVAATGLWLGNRASAFARWYGLALLLVATGLLGIWVQPAVGSAVGWAGRATQLLGGAYMLVAAFASVRETRSWRVPLEEALRRTQRRYQDLFESMTEGFALHEIILDAQGRPCDYRFVEVNPAFERLVSLRRDQLAGRRVLEVFPTTEAHWIDAYGQVALTGRSVHLENRHAGLGRWYSVYAYCPAPGQFAVICTDITHRKEAEEALRNHVREQQRQQALLEGIVHATDAMLVYLDRDFNFVWVNEAYAISCRMRPQDMIGKNHFALYPDEENEAIFGRARDAGEGAFYRDKPFVFPDQPERGTTYWDWSLQPVKDAGGAVVGLVFSLRETTERKRAEQALQAAKSALEVASAAKDQFIAKLSHELRTPLTPVVASLSALACDPRLPDDLREDMQLIQRNISLEVHLINDLLDVTRIVSGKLALSRAVIDLADVLRDVSRIVATDLDAKGQALAIDAPAGCCWVDADRARLNQVFWNLIKNAMKFSPHGARIAVEAAAAGGEARIVVRDPGEGIDPADLPRLFRAFEQGGSSQGFGGLGLGLAICRGIVELHGGTIGAQSPGRGGGAAFCVTLPLVAPPCSCGQDVPAESAREPARGPLRILLVEDHADTARMMSRLLAGSGHAVTRAGSVAAGLQAAREGDFDILLSDLGLPDGTGYDLMRQIASSGRPVRGIALSGHGAAEDVRRSFEAGFAEHITKPVSFESLHQALIRVAALPPRAPAAFLDTNSGIC